MHRPALTHPSRRHVLLGGAAGALAVACGSSGEGGSSATTIACPPEGTLPTPDAPGDVNLVSFFDPGPTYARAGAEQRLTFGLFGADRAQLVDLPDELDVTFFYQGTAEDGCGPLHREVAHVSTPRRDNGVPRAYYAPRFTPAERGTYTVETMANGVTTTAAFEVGDAETNTLPQVGDPMPAVLTPTDADPLDVDPICTRDPRCDLHTVSLDESLAAGRPIALSISTPAFCQVSICGPVLELVIDAVPTFPSIDFLHAEVWKEPFNPRGIEGTEPADVLALLGMTFEPTLFVVGTDGTIAARLDNIYDADELTETLETIA